MSQTSQAQDGYIGEIRLFAGNFVPRGWAYCTGQLLPINQYQAVYAILGTTYGGDGQTNFALPDLRGRVPVQPGTGPGLSNYVLGESSGSETIRLTTTQMPSIQFQSTLRATNEPGDTDDPTNAVLAKPENGAKIYRQVNPNVSMTPGSAVSNGGFQPVNNMQPYLGLNYIICLEGIFPSRQ
ncbi:MAG: phage tail protein [Bacteroidetes bacterium]|nr:phage tail protein [Bacteroidota bacterium]